MEKPVSKTLRHSSVFVTVGIYPLPCLHVCISARLHLNVHRNGGGGVCRKTVGGATEKEGTPTKPGSSREWTAPMRATVCTWGLRPLQVNTSTPMIIQCLCSGPASCAAGI
ncbi:hypothetical protein ILYODFUR_025805 [Ilyodon furcidens]|uniref:Uncharacterized protein n=1 Tax=Ilyodon furcidens TaxID=33524 RepID=A0ABV0TXQ5_9TELE